MIKLSINLVAYRYLKCIEQNRGFWMNFKAVVYNAMIDRTLKFS